MEEQMKFDVVNELKVNNGRLLLHEERLEGTAFMVVVFFFELASLGNSW